MTAIGIDLGTVNSCLAVCRKNYSGDVKVEIIEHQGEKITPSIVFYSPENLQVSIGHLAIDEIPSCVQNGIYDTKRFIGRNFMDEGIQSIYRDYPFKIEPDLNDAILIKIEQEDEQKLLKPEEVSAEVLKSLKNRASDYLGEDVTEAVITVPAYFSNSQREATKKAAELAGLTVLKLLNEPTAAALYYFVDREKDNITALVFDLGGGTLDISIIKLENKKILVQSIIGDSFLGGRNFDGEISKYFYDELRSKGHIIDKRAGQRIEGAAQIIKKKLTFQMEASKSLTYLFKMKNETFKMTREKFEIINKQLFDKCILILSRALDDAGLTKSDIDEVILVGGSTRIPKIQERLSAFFDGKQLMKDLNPDEAVAAGAAVQAAMMTNQVPNLYTVIDITPLSLGINSYYDLMHVIIKRNTSLPATGSYYLQTKNNNQSSMKIEIYEGERSENRCNNYLGDFTVTVPKRKAGEVQVKITFNINESGILDVTAEETTSGNKKTLTVEAIKYNFHGQKLRSVIVDAEKNETYDMLFKNYAVAKAKARLICAEYLYGKSKDSATERVKKFITELDTNTFEERSSLKGLIKKFLDDVGRVNFKAMIEIEKSIQE